MPGKQSFIINLLADLFVLYLALYLPNLQQKGALKQHTSTLKLIQCFHKQYSIGFVLKISAVRSLFLCHT